MKFIRKPGGMIPNLLRIDISRHDEYYTQINNTKLPLSACNVTSGINWLATNEEDFPEKIGVQPEDDLMDTLHSEEAYIVMKELAPWAVGVYPPNEVWVMLEWGINKMVGRDICHLDFEATLEKMISSIMKRKSVIVGGKFAGLGHFVNACGLVTAQKNIVLAKYDTDIDICQIRSIIVDDPYGNPLTNYNDHLGNSIELPLDYFLDCVRDYRKKKVVWGYYHMTAE